MQLRIIPFNEAKQLSPLNFILRPRKNGWHFPFWQYLVDEPNRVGHSNVSSPQNRWKWYGASWPRHHMCSVTKPRYQVKTMVGAHMLWHRREWPFNTHSHSHENMHKKGEKAKSEMGKRTREWTLIGFENHSKVSHKRRWRLSMGKNNVELL